MTKKTTIKDIAKALDTNISTVSRALNDSPLISPKTKKEVLEMAKKLNYSPNSIARQLREGKSRTIGLLVPRINREFFSNIIHAVQTYAHKKGYRVLLMQSNESHEDEKAALDVLISQNVAGIIMSRALDSRDEELTKGLPKQEIPLVMMDRVIRKEGISAIVNDNELGAFLAVEHLIEQGYRKILHFGGELDMHIYRERFEGYKKALAKAGIPYEEARVFKPVLTRKQGEEKMQEILDSKLEFDAIFSSGDLSALAAYLVLKEQGYRCPEDIGLVGFANEFFTELLGISSVEQFSLEMGEKASQLLFQKLSGKAPESSFITLKPELMIRASSLRKGKN
ncbi:MAG: LacI family DNA-binding transcriptional regulator [Bacteroidota bacterium]